MPQSGISGRGEPPVSLNWRCQLKNRHHQFLFHLKKTELKSAQRSVVLKNGQKKGCKNSGALATLISIKEDIEFACSNWISNAFLGRRQKMDLALQDHVGLDLWLTEKVLRKW
jgi:hypothetical protein